MMIDDIVAFLQGHRDTLPVGIVDALEAGLAALAMDEARAGKCIVDLRETWNQFDSYGLRG